MEFEINLRSKTPSYAQLADQLRARITDGTYGTDGPIPSLRMLTQETGLSLATVQSAIRVLEGEGLVIAIVGRGTFVIGRD